MTVEHSRPFQLSGRGAAHDSVIRFECDQLSLLSPDEKTGGLVAQLSRQPVSFNDLLTDAIILLHKILELALYQMLLLLLGPLHFA